MTFPALSLWQFSKSSQHRIWHTVSTQYKHPIVSLLLLLLLSIWLLCSVCSGAPQSCLTLCNSSDCSPPGSSVHGVFFFRQEYCSGVAISSSWESSQPRDWAQSPVSTTMAGRFFTCWAIEEAHLIIRMPLTSWPMSGLENNFQTWGRMRGE